MYHFIYPPSSPQSVLMRISPVEKENSLDGAAVICSSLEHVHQDDCIVCQQCCAFITHG